MDMHNIVNGFYENIEERRLHMKQELSADIQNENTAPVIAQKLYEALCSYQESLPDEDDMVLAVAHFGETVNIIVNKVGYIGYNLIVFYGEDSYGKPQKLIQHINQLDFLLTCQTKTVSEVPKRQIGFQTESEMEL